MGGQPVFKQMDPEFLLKLDECRRRCGFSFKITSSYRTAVYNKKVGGSPNSMHLEGRAVDVACTTGEQRATILQHALALGLSVGVMRNALHLDDRDGAPIVFHYYDRYEAEGK